MNDFTRCMFALTMILLGASPEQDLNVVDPKAASGGAHLWWIAPTNSDENARFELLHHATADDERQFQVASIFTEHPIALAADGDRVWLVFEALQHKMEVVSGETKFNPASELWFITRGGALQLCPSIAGDSLESLAAFDGEPWAIVQGMPGALMLRAGQWRSVELPAAINACPTRMLLVAGGVLNALGQATDNSIKRFKRQAQSWIEFPMVARDFLYAVDHSARFACVTGKPAATQVLNWVEAGELVPIAATTSSMTAPNIGAAARVLGMEDGFAWIAQTVLATQNTQINQSHIAMLPSGAAEFSEPVELRVQISKASRWYHLPILGVLSLGAIIAAFLIRALHSPLNPLGNGRSKSSATDSQTLAQPPWTPFQKWRRVVATAIDIVPCAIASFFILNADIVAILVPPLWSADIQMSIPYIAMVVASLTLSMFQEIAFGRSLGKRIMGGRVVCIHGEPAVWWQHIARNILKGLVLLSPVLAIPSWLSQTGIGIPEIISRTKVQANDLDSE